jgi:hypothetical protein
VFCVDIRAAVNKTKRNSGGAGIVFPDCDHFLCFRFVSHRHKTKNTQRGFFEKKKKTDKEATIVNLSFKIAAP